MARNKKFSTLDMMKGFEKPIVQEDALIQEVSAEAEKPLIQEGAEKPEKKKPLIQDDGRVLVQEATQNNEENQLAPAPIVQEVVENVKPLIQDEMKKPLIQEGGEKKVLIQEVSKPVVQEVENGGAVAPIQEEEPFVQEVMQDSALVKNLMQEFATYMAGKNKPEADDGFGSSYRSTQGKKGLKMKRINVGLPEDVYDYLVKTTKATGETYSGVIVKALAGMRKMG